LRRWSEPPIIREMELTIVSCNIRFDNPADGVNSWQHRRSFLTEVLLKHSPDIIATQEGRFDQLKDFECLLEDYQIIDQHRSWIKERMYPTIFCKKNRFEILESEDLWLSETPEVAGSLSFESTFPRLMTMASLQPKNHEKKILLVNAHLDHIRTETRESQAKVLVNEIKRKRKGQQSLVVLGDFNDAPGSSVQRILTDDIHGLKDTWPLYNSVEESSHHGFKGHAPDGSRIDWIMIEGEAQPLDCKMDKSSKGSFWPSDHFPIVCRISL
jgi:endonuclease/exonuclease/phosphatase family metal-dependent hydrolase